MTYQTHQEEDVQLKTPPAFKACPCRGDCEEFRHCQSQCSQPQDAAYVFEEAERTGLQPFQVLERLNQLRDA